jgi:hypothetical protein
LYRLFFECCPGVFEDAGAHSATVLQCFTISDLLHAFEVGGISVGGTGLAQSVLNLSRRSLGNVPHAPSLLASACQLQSITGIDLSHNNLLDVHAAAICKSHVSGFRS